MISTSRTHFNSRSREGSDVNLLDDASLCLCVSIHAPVKGATTAPRGGSSNGGGFNSRSREGSDIVENTELLLWFVSIHAPVKGATDYGNIVGGPDVVSIHAPVKGATLTSQIHPH